MTAINLNTEEDVDITPIIEEEVEKVEHVEESKAKFPTPIILIYVTLLRIFT